MDQIIAKLIESSVSAGLLAIVLSIFLPRLIRSIDLLTETNTRQHELISILVLNFEKRVLCNFANSIGLDAPPSDEEKKAIWTEAHRAFVDVSSSIDALGRQLQAIFSDLKGPGSGKS